MSSLQKIHCPCGQLFAPTTLDGQPRTQCPVCQRPILGSLQPATAEPVAANEPVEAVLVAELAEPEVVSVGLLEGYRPRAIATFAPPQPQPVPKEDIVGLWRDGEMIIVQRYQHRFPQRCVMTNEVLVGPTPPIELDYLPNRWAWSLFGKSIGRAIGRALYGERIVLQAGISPAWQQRHWLHRVVGTAIVWIGALLAIPAAVVQSGSRFPDSQSASLAVLGALLMVGFMGLIVGGIVVLLLSPPLRVWAVEGQFVWLRGADASFIASLPAWQGPR
jgi:hypothetical protein